MKNNLYIILVFFTTICFSQERDTLTTIDTTKTIKLKEVKITSSLNKAGVYQLLIPKKILENETLEKTIKRVSFITIDNNKNLYFKGKKISNFIFNDKPITVDEFNKLNIDEVKNIYIVSNNFNQATGEVESVIKIVQKKNIQNNIKGSLDFSQGFFQQFNYYGISLNNKFNKISSRLQISNIHNKTDNYSYQNINSNILDINQFRKLSQPFFSLQNVYDINDKSSIYIKNRFSVINDETNSTFSNLNNLQYQYLIKNYNVNLRYDRKMVNNFIMKLSFDYINFNNSINSKQENNTIELNSKQNFNEYTFSPLLQKKGTKYELLNSFVFTNRNYKFNNTSNNSDIKQNLFTYFLSYSLKINEKNSFLIGNRYQLENNNFVNKTNHFILPNFTYLTKIDSIVDVEFNFKRKLQRPSINSISNSNYFDINGNEIINQEFLNPQIDNQLSLDLYREFKKFNININFNYTFSKDYISTLYYFNNQTLTNTTINLNDFNEKSLKTSLSIPIYTETRLNINYAISRITFNHNNNLINDYINYFDASFSGPIFKKYLFSLNSFYIDKFYEYNAFYKAKPDFSFSISRNYLKDKLNLNLEFRNILNQESNRVMDFKENSNFYFQKTENQSRLLLISFTYNFGKDFKMTKKNIQNTNNDIKLK